MEDPVVAADGFTYERSWVEEAYNRAPGLSPMTGQPIATAALWPGNVWFRSCKHMFFLI